MLDFVFSQVKCRLSGHEMPCRLDAIQQYVSGKKYNTLAANSDFDFEKYIEFLVPSNKPRQELV